MTNVVLGIGTTGVAASVIWWAMFYTKILELTGATMKREDWQKGVSLFSDCMFLDRPQCVAVKAATNMTGYAAYEPLFLWFSVGILFAGILLKFNDVWQSK